MTASLALTLINFISVIIMFVCCILVYRQAPSKMQNLALLVCVSITACCIGFLIRSQATEVSAYLAGQMIAYSFVAHGIFFMFLFVLAYCRFSIPDFAKVIFCILNFVVTFSVLTTGYHQFFYVDCWAIPMDGYVEFEKIYGPLHTFAIVLLVFYLLASIMAAVIFSIKNRQRKNYVWRILFALAIPFAAYLIPRVIGINSDFLSLSAAFFCAMMLYLIYQNNLYDIDNIMSKYSIGSIDEAYIVFDGKYQIKGWNAVAEQLFPAVKAIDLDSDIRQYETPFQDFLDGTATEFRTDDKIYGVSVRTIGDRNVPEGKVIRVEDITIQRSYTELLQANIDRINHDLALAKSVQESALPDVGQVASAVEQIDVSAFMRTAKEVGGDFYDCYRLDENRVAFLMADVSDKGIPAALFMMRAKSAIRSLAEEGLPVNEVFTRANAQLAEGNTEDMFLTAWMGILDIQTGHVSFANAGHEKPIIIRADGQVEFLKGRANFVLAGFDQTSYRLQELTLNPGDGIFLYTDGATDANNANSEFFGEDRLIECLQSCPGHTAGEILNYARQSIEDHVGTADQFDDITLLAMRFLGQRDGTSVQLD